MTYDANEIGVETGQPVELFEFTAGAQTFFYTSAEDDLLVVATTYTAVAGLQRTELTEGPDTREDDFSLTLPTLDPLAQLFTGVLPGFRIRLQVSRFHRGDTPTPQVVKIFDGFLQSASFNEDGKETLLTARTALASVGKTIPRRTYQASCNHVLYDSATCKVDDTLPAFRASALSVASQVGNVLNVSSGLSGSYTDGWMNGGYVETIGGFADYRLILEHTGNALTLIVAFSTTPTTVNVYAGCDHTLGQAAGCGPKFDNVINYGGHPFVPTKNPYETGIV